MYTKENMILNAVNVLTICLTGGSVPAEEAYNFSLTMECTDPKKHKRFFGHEGVEHPSRGFYVLDLDEKGTDYWQNMTPEFFRAFLTFAGHDEKGDIRPTCSGLPASQHR
ncbi:hypothetical protein RUM43_002170 [Polyplax serrata]|uniref:Uncharacterized protein n=1 Tax=Polyplax serrata TaxID=468196 RepID=A0AAN8RVQ9_POLSC